MKKIYFRVAVICAVAASLGLSSCIGNFALTNKLLSWNKGVSNKFVNELIFFGFWVLPVYEVCALADILVLNTIEFWSGNNPVADAGSKIVEGSDGRYLVEWNEKGYTITSENDGTVTHLDFAPADNSWSLSVNDGDPVKIMSFIDDTHIEMIDALGGYQIVETSEAGRMAYEQVIAEQAGLNFMANR